MLEKEQYRSVFRYLFLKGQTRTEIFKELNEVYGADSPSFATIKRWFNDFDEEKPGRPREINENLTENLTKVVRKKEELILENCQHG